MTDYEYYVTVMNKLNLTAEILSEADFEEAEKEIEKNLK